MILPIYAALDRLDGSLIEAAEDLGCSRLQAFWLVTIPLSNNGIIAGCFLVFIFGQMLFEVVQMGPDS